MFSTSSKPKGKLLVFEGGEGVGKAQPLTEPVLTPDGWRTMADIHPGSFVIGSNGQPTRVLSVHPQGVRPIYRVTFLDGSSVRCDADHLWHVQTRKQRQRSGGHFIKTTLEMLPEFMSGNINHPYRFSVPPLSTPVAGSIEVKTAYAIGYSLGNGSFGGHQFQITTHLEDSKEVSAALSTAIGYPSRIYCPEDTLTAQHFYPWASLPLEIQEMRGLEGSDKTLPEGWLQWEEFSRLQLLRGLMDSDGGVDGKHIRFSTKAEGLKQGLIHLVRSLGGVAPNQPQGYLRGKVELDSPEYNLSVRTPMNCFSLSRKATLWEGLKKTHYLGQSITDIKFEGNEDAQCIVVEADDHLYVTSGYKLTHNSTHIKTLAHRLTVSGQLQEFGFTGLTVMRHPGGTSIGGRIRNILLHELKEEDNLDPIAEALLFASDYAQAHAEIVVPALQAGHLVISDRYTYSGLAYQGWGSGADLKKLRSIYSIATNNLEPDLVVWLVANLQVSLPRAKTASAGAADRLESKQLDFHERVYAGFSAELRGLPTLQIMTEQPKHLVADDILAQVVDFFSASTPALCCK